MSEFEKWYCPACKAEVRRKDKFCPECGRHIIPENSRSNDVNIELHTPKSGEVNIELSSPQPYLSNYKPSIPVGVPVSSQSDPYAMVSLVCGIVGLFAFPIIFSVLAIVFSYMVRILNEKTVKQQIWGRILGIVGLVLSFILALIIIFFGLGSALISAILSAILSVSGSNSNYKY